MTSPVLIAPSMNAVMWSHPAVQENVATLRARGVADRRPGRRRSCLRRSGRWAPRRTARYRRPPCWRDLAPGPLTGLKALVTSGPTYEAIDPVRFIGNRSSGKQGHAIAAALPPPAPRRRLVTGPTALPDPAGCHVHHIESAAEMLAADARALPADIAVAAAAVSDWKPAASSRPEDEEARG